MSYISKRLRDVKASYEENNLHKNNLILMDALEHEMDIFRESMQQIILDYEQFSHKEFIRHEQAMKIAKKNPQFLGLKYGEGFLMDTKKGSQKVI